MKPLAPGSILYHINLPLFLLPFVLLSLLLVFIIKIQKILSYHLYQISLLQVALKGLTTPLSRWLPGSLFVCVGAWDLSMVSYWIDTLVLKN